MKELALALQATTALASPACAQTADDKIANSLPVSGLQTCSLSGVVDLCIFKSKAGLNSAPTAPAQIPPGTDNFTSGTGTTRFVPRIVGKVFLAQSTSAAILAVPTTRPAQ